MSLTTLGQSKLAPRSAPAPVEGDFDFVIPDAIGESLYDSAFGLVDIPFAFRITRATFFLESGGDMTLSVLWGPQGVGSSQVALTALPAGTPYKLGNSDTDGIVGPATVGDLTLISNVCFVDEFVRSYSCNQAVPALGYLQINTVDTDEGGDLHCVLHYVKT